MADSAPSGFKYHSYRRVCDICGNLRPIEEMHRQDEYWVCTYDAGERVRTELDRLNARERPFNIKPVPYPKPQNPYYPNKLETDDAATFNFLSKMVSAQCRYEKVESGQAAYTAAGGGLPALSWAARYFYDLIQENSRRPSLIAQAKTLLKTIADYLQTLQRGFGFFPSATRDTDAFYGGFLDSGATSYITADASTGGLALLYAYRIHGTTAYLNGARAAASYLRNVQAIGSNGAQFTSSNSGGTARLYTGAVCSEVSTTFGIDPGQIFYSNHLFYPGDLIALEFWNELKITDGDQSVGATSAVNGFTTTPAQLLSQSITDMRTCWETGIVDSTATLINGLSTTTPHEFFNAYPQTKTGFNFVGTGNWEYSDGNSATGTQITSQNIARAISALYNYEGASSQVTTISDWLRSFTSNPAFETPAADSTVDLYHSTTGTYDPTASIATILQVRDPSTLAATAINASSLYDWGAFGLLSRIWASRNKGSFLLSRLYPLNSVQRYFDGTFNDGCGFDRIILRGLSGLSMQTGFASDINNPSGPSSFTIGGSGSTATPPMEGLVFWVRGDSGIESSPAIPFNILTAWRDKGPLHQDLDTIDSGFEPAVGVDSIDGTPCVTFATGANGYRVAHTGYMLDRNRNPIGYATGQTQTRTLMAVMLPRTGFVDGANLTAGQVFGWNGGPEFSATQCFMYLHPKFVANGFYVFDTLGPYGPTQIQGPPTPGSTYSGKPTFMEWRLGSFPAIACAVNGSEIALNPPAIPGAFGANDAADFTLGNTHDAVAWGFSFQGAIAEVLVWDFVLSGPQLTAARHYIAQRYPSVPNSVNIQVTNDAVRAAQFGRSFREARS